jgi:hypothetical protein
MQNKNAYRHIFLSILQANPPIVNISGCNEFGDMEFAIKISDCGLSLPEIRQYESELFSFFCVDFLGEYFIRENLDSFIDKLQDYNVQKYVNSINKYGKHKYFGIKISSTHIIFKFQVSLINKIISDNLRESF